MSSAFPIPSDLSRPLDGGEVVVLLSDLSALSEPSDPAAWGLDPAEAARAARFHRARDRLAFLAGRGLLRGALSRLGVRGDVRVDGRGKPHCPSPGAPHFNLSHGGGWVALALKGDGPVGVDVEDTRRRVRTEAVARRCFTSAEREWARGRPDGFFRIWIRKEARGKAVGTGLGEEAARTDTLAEEARGDWSYALFDPAPGVVGCAAWRGSTRPVRLVECVCG